MPATHHTDSTYRRGRKTAPGLRSLHTRHRPNARRARFQVGRNKSRTVSARYNFLPVSCRTWCSYEFGSTEVSISSSKSDADERLTKVEKLVFMWHSRVGPESGQEKMRATASHSTYTQELPGF